MLRASVQKFFRKDAVVMNNLPLMAIFDPKKCAREKMRLTNDSQTLLRLEWQMVEFLESYGDFQNSLLRRFVSRKIKNDVAK